MRNLKNHTRSARITRSEKFNAEKMMKYAGLFVLPSSEFLKSLKEIRLAIDAIKVPSPPIFTLKSNSVEFAVKPESKIAAGTLLIIWLEISPAR